MLGAFCLGSITHQSSKKSPDHSFCIKEHVQGLLGTLQHFVPLRGRNWLKQTVAKIFKREIAQVFEGLKFREKARAVKDKIFFGFSFQSSLLLGI